MVLDQLDQSDQPDQPEVHRTACARRPIELRQGPKACFCITSLSEPVRSRIGTVDGGGSARVNGCREAAGAHESVVVLLRPRIAAIACEVSWRSLPPVAVRQLCTHPVPQIVRSTSDRAEGHAEHEPADASMPRQSV